MRAAMCLVLPLRGSAASRLLVTAHVAKGIHDLIRHGAIAPIAAFELLFEELGHGYGCVPVTVKVCVLLQFAGASPVLPTLIAPLVALITQSVIPPVRL